MIFYIKTFEKFRQRGYSDIKCLQSSPESKSSYFDRLYGSVSAVRAQDVDGFVGCHGYGELDEQAGGDWKIKEPHLKEIAGEKKGGKINKGINLYLMQSVPDRHSNCNGGRKKQKKKLEGG